MIRNKQREAVDPEQRDVPLNLSASDAEILQRHLMASDVGLALGSDGKVIRKIIDRLAAERQLSQLELEARQ